MYSWLMIAKLTHITWIGFGVDWGDIPSGYVKIAIENGHRNSGCTDLPIKNGGSDHSFL